MGWYPRKYRGSKVLDAAYTAEATFERGAVVEVYKGRKVPVGTVGVIIWIGAGQFGTRVGVKDEAGTVHWTAALNVRPLCQDCA